MTILDRIGMQIHPTRFISLMTCDLLNMLTNFALLSLAEFDHFNTFPGWVAGAKLRLSTNTAQLKLKLGLNLTKTLKG